MANRGTTEPPEDTDEYDTTDGDTEYDNEGNGAAGAAE